MNVMIAPASLSGAAPGDDERFMAAAILLGLREQGRTWPNPSVGALVVKDGVVIGRGWTRAGGRPHAETIALAEAGNAARGATLYVSLEPCSHHGATPPCVDAITAAGIARVVSATEDPNPEVSGRGYWRLRGAGIEVTENVLRAQALKAHEGHIARVREGRPYVTLKLAISSNGKAALAGRRPAPITGEMSRDLVHRMRARHDAIAVGVGTVLSDDPLLTVRLPAMEDRSPVRVVFDSALRLPLTAQLVATAREVPLWVIAEEGASHDIENRLAPHGIEILRVPLADDGVDVGAALKALAGKGITRLMVEGGPHLAMAFLKAGLVDQAVIFQSSDPLGDDGVDALPEPHEKVLPQLGLNLRGRQDAGDDAVFLYERG